MRPLPLPEHAYLRDCFDYDPATGVLTWKHRADRSAQWNSARAGKPAGTVSHRHSPINRKIVGLDYRVHLVSRVIWKLMTGEDPVETIDHRNGDPLDDRWENLREATAFEQNRNRKRMPLNKHGLRGVAKSSRNKLNPWVAQIYKDGKLRYLGGFPTPEEAHAAYKAAATEHHGEFYAEPEAM